MGTVRYSMELEARKCAICESYLIPNLIDTTGFDGIPKFIVVYRCRNEIRHRIAGSESNY